MTAAWVHWVQQNNTTHTVSRHEGEKNNKLTDAVKSLHKRNEDRTSEVQDEEVKTPRQPILCIGN